MTKLKQLIFEKINAQGPITVAEYMELCLYHPQYGYYSTKQPFGQMGDFITSPEISQVFGELIGAYFAELIKNYQLKDYFLVELGPGQGLLMSDILRVFASQKLLSKTNLIMVENSPRLTLIQQQKLQNINLNSTKWVDKLSFINPDSPIFIIANEFLDALPTHSFIKINDNWHEQVINIQNQDLTFTYQNSITKHQQFLNDYFNHHIDGSIVEINFNAIEYIKNIDNLINHNNGIAIIIDYGYQCNKTQTSFKSTLQSIKNHHFNDNFAFPGEADITTHINFSLLEQFITKSQVKQIITQKEFLLNLGIELRFDQLIKKNPIYKNTLLRQCDRLINDTQMGQLFKVISISKFI